MKICDKGYKQVLLIVFRYPKKEAGKLIGAVAIHINKDHQKGGLGYWLGKFFLRKGCLTESEKEILKFGFQELQLNKIFATHFLYNPASEKVMQKAGMKLEGLQKQEYFHQGKFLDVNRYAILREDFS